MRFVEETGEFIKKCLESFHDEQEEENTMEIGEESPLAMEIAAK
jgi:hypothetical protein